MIRIACLLMGVSACMHGVELSKDVLKEQAKYQSEVESIVREAEKDINEAREEYIEDLEKALKVAMRKADLHGAQAIQNKIKSLQETNMTKLFGEASGDEADVLAKPEKKAVTVTVLRAYAVPRNGDKRVDITEQVQALVNAGKTKVCPIKDLAELTGIRNRAEFLYEVQTVDGVKRGRSRWISTIDLATGQSAE